MVSDQEIEAKFRLTKPETELGLQEWPELAGGYPLTPATQVVHVDTYYDTGDLLLLRTGVGLRLRVQDGTVVVTMKSIDLHAPRGLHARREVERAAPELSADMRFLMPGHLPAEVAAALPSAIDAETRLRPICRLHQVRIKRNVLPASGTNGSGPLAELSIDRVTVQRVVAPPGSGRKAMSAPAAVHWQDAAHFAEVEVEQLGEAGHDGDSGAFAEIVGRLRDLPGVVPNDLNKLQAALLAIADGAPSDPAEAGHMHVAELCRAIWAQQLARMVVNEAGVRASDDIEYVHEMRVATRRARAAGRLYAAYFEAESRRVPRFLRRLRTTGRLLGAVRDLDVALARLARVVGTRPEQEQGELDALAAHWRTARERAHRTLLAWLDSRKYRRFVRDLSRFTRTPGAAVRHFKPVPGEAPPPHQLRHTIPGMILSRYERIRAFETLFEDDAPVPVETLHALRIECKYLRYHLEFNARLLGNEGAELIADLKALQEHLGDLNDAFVSAQMLADVPTPPAGDNPEGNAAPSGALHAYLAHQQVAIESLRARVPYDLQRCLSHETRRKLALALAHI